MKALVVCKTHVEVYVNKSKNDVYRRGNKVLLTKTGNKLIPVFCPWHYLNSADLKFNLEDFFVHSS